MQNRRSRPSIHRFQSVIRTDNEGPRLLTTCASTPRSSNFFLYVFRDFDALFVTNMTFFSSPPRTRQARPRRMSRSRTHFGFGGYRAPESPRLWSDLQTKEHHRSQTSTCHTCLAGSHSLRESRDGCSWRRSRKAAIRRRSDSSHSTRISYRSLLIPGPRRTGGSAAAKFEFREVHGLEYHDSNRSGCLGV